MAPLRCGWPPPEASGVARDIHWIRPLAQRSGGRQSRRAEVLYPTYSTSGPMRSAQSLRTPETRETGSCASWLMESGVWTKNSRVSPTVERATWYASLPPRAGVVLRQSSWRNLESIHRGGIPWGAVGPTRSSDRLTWWMPDGVVRELCTTNVLATGLSVSLRSQCIDYQAQGQRDTCMWSEHLFLCSQTLQPIDRRQEVPRRTE